MTTARPRADRTVRRWDVHAVCCAGLATIFWIQATSIRRATSATFDEGIYLQLALEAVQRGRFQGLIDQGVAPLPVLVAYAEPALMSAAREIDRRDLGANDRRRATPAPGGEREDARVGFAALIERARGLYALFIGMPLVLLVYGWMASRRGVHAGLLAGILVALSPTVVAHASIATTDACLALTSLITLAALAAYDARRSVARWLAVGLALGLAFASKYSATFLLVVAALSPLPAAWPGFRGLAGSASRRAPWQHVVSWFGSLAGWACLALLVAWALHLFAVAPLFSPDVAPVDYERVLGNGPLASAALQLGRAILVPAPVKGMLRQSVHMLLGQPAFLDGEVSLRGWWSYFPRALAMKSTPVELLLAVVALAGTASRRTDFALRLWRWSILIVGALAIASPLDTGVRYVLVLYPLVILCGVDELAARIGARDRRLFAVVAGALAAFEGMSAWSIAPRQLSYFNSFVAGPERGHLHLVDSNLDWGQDLPALRDAAARLGIRDLRLAYFGTAPPEAYGVSALRWTDDGLPGEGAWLAVSATYLHGLYLGGDPFAALRGVEPDARAGYSIFLYDLRRPEVRRAYAMARGLSTASAAADQRANALDRLIVGP